MPIISLSQEAMDRGKTPEKGWSPATLNDATEQKAKSTDSINYFFDFALTGGPEKKSDNAGRFATYMVNSAGLNKGLGADEFKRMIAALNDIPLNEVQPDSYDTDKLKGKPCWVQISIVMVDGKPKAQITDFAAFGEVPF